MEINKKAISLLSDGLDCILATELIMEQGIDVTALHFHRFSSPVQRAGMDAAARRSGQGATARIRSYGGLG